LPREKSEYIGGEIRIPSEDYETKIALFFESFHWKSKNFHAMNILNTYLNYFILKEKSTLIKSDFHLY